MDPFLNEVSALLLVYPHRKIFSKLTSYAEQSKKIHSTAGSGKKKSSIMCVTGVIILLTADENTLLENRVYII